MTGDVGDRSFSSTNAGNHECRQNAFRDVGVRQLWHGVVVVRTALVEGEVVRDGGGGVNLGGGRVGGGR